MALLSWYFIDYLTFFWEYSDEMHIITVQMQLSNCFECPKYYEINYRKSLRLTQIKMLWNTFFFSFGFAPCYFLYLEF